MCQVTIFVFLFCSLSILFMNSNIFDLLGLTVVPQSGHKRILYDYAVIHV